MEQFLMVPTKKKLEVMQAFMQRLTVMSLLVTLCGCQTGEPGTAKPEDVAAETHHDTAPLNFADALKKVEEAKEKICVAFEQGTPDEAHDALHQVGHMLEDLPQLATQGRELSTETVSAINQAVESLFDGFGKLDDTMHGGAEVELDKIKQQLTQSLANLRKVLP
jgi:hypothetical protein